MLPVTSFSSGPGKVEWPSVSGYDDTGGAGGPRITGKTRQDPAIGGGTVFTTLLGLDQISGMGPIYQRNTLGYFLIAAPGN